MAHGTVLIGLFGTGIQGSAAPAIHMGEGARLGLRLVYELIDFTLLGLDAAALPEMLVAAERMGFDGLAVTHPFKQAVMPHLTGLSEDAEALGAVNTVLLEDGRRMGHNTDWTGWAEAFREQFGGVARGRVVQLGAGGAGAAVAYAGLKLGFERLCVFDTDPGRAAALVARLGARFGAARVVVGQDLEAEMAQADGLVNATPIGMAAHPGTPLPPGLLRPGLWVSDVIYAPRETALLRGRAGHGAAGGERRRHGGAPGGRADAPLDRAAAGCGAHAGAVRGRVMGALDFSAVVEKLPELLWGVAATFGLAVAGIALALAIGVGGVVTRSSANPVVRNGTRAFIEIIRNTPFLVQIFFLFFALPNLGLKLNPTATAIIALGLNGGAYAIEIIRGGVQSIHAGQSEAGLALGLHRGPGVPADRAEAGAAGDLPVAHRAVHHADAHVQHLLVDRGLRADLGGAADRERHVPQLRGVFHHHVLLPGLVLGDDDRVLGLREAILVVSNAMRAGR